MKRSLKDLKLLAKNKGLKLKSDYNQYEDKDSVLEWECLKCNLRFFNSTHNIQRNKHPCPNCRKKFLGHSISLKKKNKNISFPLDARNIICKIVFYVFKCFDCFDENSRTQTFNTIEV